MNDDKYRKLQENISYHFNDITLLKLALTHSSYANETGQERSASNERLEFLGDALLETIISLLIYRREPIMSEGEMTKLRAELVCEKSLFAKATEIDIGSYLLLGHGESSGSGRERPSILADAFEALIAAIYLDGGFEPAMRFIEKMLGAQISKKKKSTTDYKSLLQECVQLKPGVTVTYEPVSEKGPDHDKTFTVQVKINGKPAGKGSGKSKKSAEQAAAKKAISKIKGEK